MARRIGIWRGYCAGVDADAGGVEVGVGLKWVW